MTSWKDVQLIICDGLLRYWLRFFLSHINSGSKLDRWTNVRHHADVYTKTGSPIEPFKSKTQRPISVKIAQVSWDKETFFQLNMTSFHRIAPVADVIVWLLIFFSEVIDLKRGDWHSWCSQVISLCGNSADPIAYQMQASQWAINANVAISKRRTAAPYSEYLQEKFSMSYGTF